MTVLVEISVVVGSLALVAIAVASVRAVADRFEILGERTANLSAAVLGEIEGPVHTAVAVARGLRSVTAYFLERLSHRATPGRPTTNGGPDRE